MRVYIRHINLSQRRVLAEVATAADAEELATSVAHHGAFVDEQDVSDEVTTQYVSDSGGEIGFEIIVGSWE